MFEAEQLLVTGVNDMVSDWEVLNLPDAFTRPFTATATIAGIYSTNPYHRWHLDMEKLTFPSLFLYMLTKCYVSFAFKGQRINGIHILYMLLLRALTLTSLKRIYQLSVY